MIWSPNMHRAWHYFVWNSLMKEHVFTRYGMSYRHHFLVNEVCCFLGGGQFAWWRHQMETGSSLLAICAGNSPATVNSPHKDQWRGALMFSLIWTWINDWVNSRESGDLWRHRAHCDVIVMERTGNACRCCEWGVIWQIIKRVIIGFLVGMKYNNHVIIDTMTDCQY